MQTQNQGKRPKDWKVVAAIATASALGLSGLALAGPDERSTNPDPINLQDRTSISQLTTRSSPPVDIAGILDMGDSSDRGSLESSLYDSSPSADSPAPAPAVVSPAPAVVSPSPAPAPAPAPGGGDSSWSNSSFSNSSFSADSS